MIWLSLCLLFAGCDDPVVLGDDTGIPDNGGSAPALTLDAPAVADNQNAVTVTGTAADADQPTVTLGVKLKTSVGGQTLFEGNPDSDGNWGWTGVLALGDQVLTASVRDSDGNETVVTANVAVSVGNQAPNCEIRTPADGAVFPSGTPIIFDAWWNDPDDDEISLQWTSSISGSLFQGETWDPIIEDGAHRITLVGTDAAGRQCTDEVDITVGP